jgi:hypothetical protein
MLLNVEARKILPRFLPLVKGCPAGPQGCCKVDSVAGRAAVNRQRWADSR